MRRRELAGLLGGMVVAGAALTIAVVISGNYEDLGDRSVPFIYSPGAAVLGAGAALAIADGRPLPDFVQSILAALWRAAVRFYRS